MSPFRALVIQSCYWQGADTRGSSFCQNVSYGEMVGCEVCQSPPTHLPTNQPKLTRIHSAEHGLPERRMVPPRLPRHDERATGEMVV